MGTTADKSKPAHVGQALSVWKEAHAAHGAAFVKKRDVQLLWRELTGATDTLMRTLAGPKETRFSVVAVGGYGRGELFPYSDIDLLILVPEGEVPTPSIERVLYGLWDMPLALGHAVRTVQQSIDVARAEHTVMSAMLDMRHVAGNEALTAKLAKRVRRELIGVDVLKFVEAKLKERDVRHTHALDSRFVLEPNVKEGKGALRDLHTIWWLARYCYDVERLEDLTKGSIFTDEDVKAYREAMEFLATVRASLHMMAGRAEERLTFDAQLKLAETYHYRRSGEESAKRFMKHYFHHVTRVGELTRSFCTLLEEEKKRKPTSLTRFFARPQKLGAFVMEGERLSTVSETQLREDPVLMLELFATAQAEELELHPHAMKHIAAALGAVTAKHRASERAVGILKDILLSSKEPDVTLRRMNEAGVLSRFMPEFSHIAGQMQYDRYHTYTVDEHTLVAVANLNKLERGEWRETMPIATDIIAQIRGREALYMAMLLHDIGKGHGKQAERGEVISREIAKRMHCSAGDVETISWLVANHLLMSEVAFKRDLDDPKTIADFAAAVQTPERLRLLLLVTVADICAVGPKVWNGWKGALLRDLYKRTMAQVAGEALPTRAVEAYKKALGAILQEEGWSELACTRFIGMSVPPAFWQRDADEQLTLARLYRMHKESEDISQHVVRHAFHAVTEMTLCLETSPALLPRIAGAASLMGASIVSAKMMGTADGVSWVSIGLQDVGGHAFDEAKAVEQLARIYHETEEGTRDMSADLARARPKYFAKRAKTEPAHVVTDNALSATHSVIEVSGADRIGFLHDVAKALADAGMVIGSAHVATYGARAVDVFYVKDAYGHKLVHPMKRELVEQAVLDAIG